VKNRVFALIVWALVGLFVLAGCGGGGGSSAPATPATGVTLTGRALVPAGTPTKAVGTDIPLPFAGATLTDITAGLPGATFATTQTNGQGGYQFNGLANSHSYVLNISKNVTGPQTIHLAAYVHVSSTGVIATGTSTSFTLDADESTTVAANYIFSLINSGSAAPGDDLSDVANNMATTFDTERHDGTAPTIDLGKDPSDPNSFSGATQQIVNQGQQTGAYFGSSRSSSNTLANLLFDKSVHKVGFVLCVMDAAGNFFDADYFAGTTSNQGDFAGTTTDGLYTVKGHMTVGSAFGTWAAVDGSSKGAWVANLQTSTSANVSKGYVGSFTKNGRTGNEGTWFFFVDKNGNALMLAHDEAFPQRSHLLKTAIITGTVDGSGTITGGLVFPAVAGSVTGGNPLTGGTASGGGTGNAGSHTGSGTGTVTGAFSGNTVSGTWSFSGLRDGSSFNATGSWSGFQL